MFILKFLCKIKLPSTRTQHAMLGNKEQNSCMLKIRHSLSRGVKLYILGTSNKKFWELHGRIKHRFYADLVDFFSWSYGYVSSQVDTSDPICHKLDTSYIDDVVATASSEFLGRVTLHFHCFPELISVGSDIIATSRMADDILTRAATTLSADELIRPLVDRQVDRGAMLREMADNSSHWLAQIPSDGESDDLQWYSWNIFTKDVMGNKRFFNNCTYDSETWIVILFKISAHTKGLWWVQMFK